MAKKVFYDKDYDILTISNLGENEKVRKNFMFDDVTISITGSGKIVSVELNDASKYLGLDPDILNNILDANLIVRPKKDSVYIGFEAIGNKIIQQRIPVANIPISCIN